MSIRLVFGERCHYCSKFRPTSEVRKIGTGGAKICFRCIEWHDRAVRVLAGDPPPGCQECGITFKELKAYDTAGNLRMYLHAKDGIYQILCTPCSDKYERKRADLYRETVYGKSRGI
jgi:hypothetical protein